MKTPTETQIEKEIEEAVLSCPYNKVTQNKEHRCSDCRTETDILEAKLEGCKLIREEFKKKIEELKEKTRFDYMKCNGFSGRFGNREIEVKIQRWFIEEINKILGEGK